MKFNQGNLRFRNHSRSLKTSVKIKNKEIKNNSLKNLKKTF